MRIDQLPKQEFRASTNQSSDNLIYDNTLECLAIIQGTRKGDIIDYAYSVHGGNPVTEGHFSHWFSLDYSVPIAHIFGRVVRHRDERPLLVKLLSPLPIEIEAPHIIEKDDTTEYRFERKDVAPINTDDNLPYEYLAYSYCIFSDWESWSEISNWGRKHYHYQNLDLTLPKDLSQQLTEWKSLNDPKAQALAALDWVQEEIRYVGINIGPHNYKPYTVEQTLARSFGDCKDKTQLLCYLLNEMGIVAYPTLVSTSSRGLIENYLPSASSFNHVITTVQIDGETYWIDPTNSGQSGSIEHIWMPNYRLGLNLIEGSDQLVSVLGQGFKASKTFTKETFAMSEYNADIELSVYTRYEGEEADSQRRMFERTNSAENEKDYLNFYAQNYPDITLREPLRHEDNTERNIFEVYESYAISNAWQTDEDDESVSYLYPYPEIMRSWTFVSDTRIRTMPAAQNYPLDQTQVIEVILPEPGDFEDESSGVHTPWFSFQKTVETDDNKLIIKYTNKHLTPTIAAADYPEYTQKVDELLDELGYPITYTDSEKQATETDGGTPSRPYIATYLSAALAAVLALICAAWIGSRKQTPPKTPTDPELDGIGGWLILVAIGVLFTPVSFITGLYDQAEYFDSAWMLNYVDINSVNHIPGFELLLLSEIAVNVFYLILSFTLIYTFFKKRAIFRFFYIGLGATSLILIIIDQVVTNQLLLNAGYDTTEFDVGIVTDIVRLMIWSAYMLIADRARSTFRH